MKTLVTLAHPSEVLLDISEIVLPVYWRSHAVVQVEFYSFIYSVSVVEKFELV